MRYTVGFSFLNKYDATKKHPWGGKGSIILKLQNDINIPNRNNISMVLEITKKVLLSKAYGFKLYPDLKGRSKTGRKSMIDMDYQEAKIIADAVDSGMSTLNAWPLVNNHREVEEIPSVCISDVGTCISKLKSLFENVKNKKQGSLDRNKPTHKEKFLWCLQWLLQINLITVGYE